MNQSKCLFQSHITGLQFISALLSQPVQKCLTLAGVALPSTQFVFTNHASCLRGSGNNQSALKRAIHYSECKNLRIQAQVMRDSCTNEAAQRLVDTAVNRNHEVMTHFCDLHGIVPARNSFRYCPYEVVSAVFTKMLEMGKPTIFVRPC